MQTHNAEMASEYDRLHEEIAELREKQIFFIGGAARSGTTWLQLLLNAHPEISCGGEGHFINKLAPLLHTALNQHCVFINKKNSSVFQEVDGYPVLDHQDFLYLLGSCISLLLRKQSKQTSVRAIGEKTPDNIEHFDELSDLFPKAKFIHVVRDGRDCAVSMWYHNERIKPGWGKQKFGSLDEFASIVADRWGANLEMALTFSKTHPDRIYQIRYEDLLSETIAKLSDLCTFLEVDSDKILLTRCAEAASFSNLSGGRKAGDEDRSSFFRKGVPADWRHHLGERAAAEFRNRAGLWLNHFGYP
jgi:hypothetical protein